MPAGNALNPHEKVAITALDQGTTTGVARRFWSWVCVGNPDECWPWTGYKPKRTTGYKPKRTYGQFTFRGKPKRAHVVAFFLTHGYWPKPECMHSCDNPPCCNPAHLKEGTRSENERDKVLRFRHSSQKLTKEDVFEIRERLANGETQAGLAFKYKVSKSTIADIVHERSWSWLQ